MLHAHSIDDVLLDDAWVSIGSFDGVHRGHQEIIRRLVAGAHSVDAPAVVVTFHPHPAEILGRTQGAFYLTLPDERASLLGEYGIDVVITHPFTTQVAATSARDFVQRLKERLGLKQLWVGPDFALGHGREGNVPTLRRFGEEMDFQVNVVDILEMDGEAVSSSRVRELLRTGEVKRAASLLGRYYDVSGVVIPGDQRGRLIGIPTANLSIANGKLIPAVGVYACRAKVEDRKFAAAANIGVRPTFDGGSTAVHVEAHLLDFNDDLYGKTVKLEFFEYLRGEIRFPGVAALVEQIQRDIDRTREIIHSQQARKANNLVNLQKEVR